MLYNDDMIRSPKRLALSLLISYGAAALGSLATFPSIQGWYAELAKPDFNPPNWVFGPVWTLLYTLMGVALYIVWQQRSKQSKRLAFIFFGLQLALNTLWSVVFFGLHLPLLGVAVIVTLLLAIILTATMFWQFSKLAASMLIPYVAWVSFATALNIAIAVLN